MYALSRNLAHTSHGITHENPLPLKSTTDLGIGGFSPVCAHYRQPSSLSFKCRPIRLRPKQEKASTDVMSKYQTFSFLVGRLKFLGAPHRTRSGPLVQRQKFKKLENPKYKKVELSLNHWTNTAPPRIRDLGPSHLPYPYGNQLGKVFFVKSLESA
ncbi:hypothetical protein Taro_053184 [Colocasia esculenta]|uniref:Uncharacterized protein n=1 Tax=Colocasia esculenta TaxID=4460 RepID=A0A843XM28_COLES|nr:hypothetical protein [Colocasia esculenta]